jgi:hypothetical protein
MVGEKDIISGSGIKDYLIKMEKGGKMGKINFKKIVDQYWFDIPSVFFDIIPPMIEKLKEHHMGYPSSLTSEIWEEILGTMLKGFEAGKRLFDMENWVMNPGCEMTVVGKEVKFTGNWTKKQIAEFKRLDMKDKRTFGKGMKLFSKYLLSLWD